MKLYLFYEDSIYSYILPKELEGSYSFDVDKNETSKLVNVEVREGKWVIYSIEGVNLIHNNNYIESLPLTDDSFYVVNRNEKNYLIYASDIAETKFNLYSYDNLSMVISNLGSCNIKYDCSFLGNDTISFTKQNDAIVLQPTKLGYVYVNDKMVKENSYVVKTGDTVTIFGLKIMFLKNMILMNNPGGKVSIPNFNFGLSLYTITADENGKNFPIIDKDLYNKQDYFSKAPRVRRIIETKKIKLSPPPSKSENEELPLILTIGPMATMGLMSGMTIINVVMQLSSGETTMEKSWVQLVTGGAMLMSMLFWPLIMNAYNKRAKKRQRKELIEKYDDYLAEKEKEVVAESNLQKEILVENLITVPECLNIINKKSIGFWDKRVDQNDFLVVRLGMGRQKLDLEIQYPEQEFTTDEDELRKRADAMVARYEYINNVPASYSFYENKITDIMGDKNKSFSFVDNMLLQLLTFYSYEDLKLVIFTTEENEKHWEYVKYLNHNFNNERNFRFFAASVDAAKVVMEYLNGIMSMRVANAGGNDKSPQKPHYLVIIDDYDSIKRFDFIKELTEVDDEIGFSMIIIEDKLSKLPSKCNNFISLGLGESSVLKNSYEKQQQETFKDEINYNIDMMSVAKVLSNTPIEFEDGLSSLPDSISFLEMLSVGKVEQLNILNKWNSNDSTMSLRSEIGVDDQGDMMYLDLHEKYHGPHGLIAGTTGSGKSEFIITYILSMCINYSPDDIAFILIDYKGGGLALAFENKTTGISLPHLAGTITNLDKAEMDRTLVSIDSEVKRRQEMFNAARDKLNESTIDIYKYQKFYNEGKVSEPIPHLFIICDEFAELKAQQPDFMDNLISVARIGRSLGVHLILATQKPSGVVNDQIWSNTRFRVCLKVQDEADSKEMLKRPEAAHIRQAGRYYLQVGYDEFFALGQSGWCGAKYFPSDKIVKQVDKSINFIDDCGQFVKSIQASSGPKTASQGEQLQAVMKSIIDISNKVNKKARRLWLENIPETILINDLEAKYNVSPQKYHPVAIIGEYDAPEKQQQGKVSYDFLEDGNMVIYGNDGSERESLINILVYSAVKNYTAEEINFYFIDYGSESLSRYQALPHVGGMVFQGEDEKYNNLLKLLRKETSFRKKEFINYGGEYKNYIKNSPNKIPLIVVVVNNYDSIYEANQNAYDDYPDLVRDSERYGIIYIFTGNGVSSINRKISQNLPDVYAFKLKDAADYTTVFGVRTKMVPRDIFGRGVINNDGIHEFQVAKIMEDEDKLNEYLQEFIQKQKELNPTSAKRIPTLPAIVKYRDIEREITDLTSVPIGIYKNSLEVATLNLQDNLGSIITSNRVGNILIFAKSLLYILRNVPNVNLLVIDAKKELQLSTDDFVNYYTENIDKVTENLIDYFGKLEKANTKQKTVLFIFNISRYINTLSDSKMINDLFKSMKGNENISVLMIDDYTKIKNYQFEEWYKSAFMANDGLWVGKGVSEQTLFRLATMNKEMTADYKNNMGYVISENRAELCKLIDFISTEEDAGNGE